MRCVISAFILCLSVFMLSSCSDEPKVSEGFINPVQKGVAVQGDVDFDVLSRYVTASDGATYTLVEASQYNKDDLTNGRWELKSEREPGGGIDMPAPIIIRDGRAWKQVTTFRCTGPTAFGLALDCVNARSSKKYKPYVGLPIKLDVQNSNLNIGYKKYDITQADDKTLILSQEDIYYGGRTHNGGSHLTFGFYKIAEPYIFNEDTDMLFKSGVEAYDWLIDLFRETFGEEVNRNTLPYAHGYLDYPIFKLSTLEEEREIALKYDSLN